MKKLYSLLVFTVLSFILTIPVYAATPEDYSGYPYVKSCRKSNPNDIFLNYCLYTNENHEVFLFSEGTYTDLFGYFNKSEKTLYYDYDGIITSRCFTSNNGGSSYSDQGKTISNKFFNSKAFTCLHCDFPAFMSKASAENYYLRGIVDDDAYIPEPPAPEFDPFSSDYDDAVPVPQVITKFNVIAGVTTPIISFTNGSTDYNVVIYGRWNSINDVTLRKEKLHWVYDYTSLLHGDLECWVSDEDNRSSRDNFDFFSDSHFTDTYQSFLLKYPLSERYITNDPTLFEKLTGYNEALYNFTDLYMKMPNNAYSKPDFFFRFYYRDEEQNIHYSRWAHLTFPLVPPGENGFETTTDQLWKGNLDYQVSNKPLTSEEVLDEKTYFDPDQTKYNILNNQQSYDLDQIDWTMSLDNLQSLTSVFGQMPAFVATVFSCYPAWMVQMIGATITILCALAIYHGIRG